MGGNTTNGHTAQRITNAILGVKMDNLSDDVQDIKETLKDHCKADEKWRSGMSQRMRDVEIDQRELKTELRATVRNATWFNGIYASITAIAAGIFGSRS